MDKKNTLRISFWLFFLPVFVAGTFLLKQKYVENYVWIPTGDILVVDSKSNAKKENGSEIYPFRTINAALEAVANKRDFHKIVIKEGLYAETLQLNGDISLIGLGEVKIVNDDILKNTIEIISGRPFLYNLEISGGKDAIFLRKDAGANINHCEMMRANHYGISNESQDATSDEKGINVYHSKIAFNGSQGMYLRKAKIFVANCLVEKNDEEGIDLHTGVLGVIRDNEIIDNGEGGIETEIGDNDLIIENNKIMRNKASGINLQSSIENARVLITGNEIKENANFGIRCSYHSDVIRPYFAKYMTIVPDNDISNNGEGSMPGTCTNKDK